MSYQRFGTPKIYVDNINWWLSTGILPSSEIIATGASFASGSSVHGLFDLKPSNVQTWSTNGTRTPINIFIDMASGTGIDANFISILGHNFEDAGAKFSLQADDSSSFSSPQNVSKITLTSVVNANAQSDTDTGVNQNDTGFVTDSTETVLTVSDGSNFYEGDWIKIDNEIMYVDSVSSNDLTIIRGTSGTSASGHTNTSDIYFTGYSAPATNGWSLATFSFPVEADNRYIRLRIDPDGAADDTFQANVQIGAILIGETYVFPNSPDLNIRRNLSFEGVKKRDSVGGQTYANAQYLRPGKWISEPFYNYSGNVASRSDRSGRASVDMSFSYLADTNAFPEHFYSRDGVRESNNITSNLINKTNGGMYPFLFQYDKDATDQIDSFLWCRLNNEPQFTQVANRVWNTSIKLREEF